MEPVQPRGEPLLALIARTLFTHDAAGRLIDVNEPGGPRAPRFYMLWDGHDLLWRVRHDLPSSLVAALAAIVTGHPAPHDLERLPLFAEAIRTALAEHAAVANELGGFEYVFPEEVHPPDAPAADSPGAAADVIAVTAENAAVLQRWLPEWSNYAATGLPMMAALVDGAAVAVAACVRFPGDATEAGVETHAAFRGRGHAAMATAAWARAVRAHGLVPLYGTSWRNHASQRVAAKLGLIRVAASLGIA
ncbi:MAG TPA: GNAT family N-acetyltransferase [Kofleriaceae bacterium]